MEKKKIFFSSILFYIFLGFNNLYLIYFILDDFHKI
jgi:hypothetical protein